jgi:hypothetical protein
MRQRVRQTLLVALLTLYGVATLSGPALHALPGLGHGLAKLTSSDEKIPGQSDRHHNAAHDCPVCHFNAQGQLNVDPATAMLVDVVRIRPADHPSLTFPSAPDRPSTPRAPPLA